MFPISDHRLHPYFPAFSLAAPRSILGFSRSFDCLAECWGNGLVGVYPWSRDSVHCSGGPPKRFFILITPFPAPISFYALNKIAHECFSHSYPVEIQQLIPSLLYRAIPGLGTDTCLRYAAFDEPASVVRRSQR